MAEFSPLPPAPFQKKDKRFHRLLFRQRLPWPTVFLLTKVHARRNSPICLFQINKKNGTFNFCRKDVGGGATLVFNKNAKKTHKKAIFFTEQNAPRNKFYNFTGIFLPNRIYTEEMHNVKTRRYNLCQLTLTRKEKKTESI